MFQGNCLDSFARRFLWDVGLDYMHGTGHGIGSYLNVHEGPMGISWRQIPDDPGLQSGMFLSNGNIKLKDKNIKIQIQFDVNIFQNLDIMKMILAFALKILCW